MSLSVKERWTEPRDQSKLTCLLKAQLKQVTLRNHIDVAPTRRLVSPGFLFVGFGQNAAGECYGVRDNQI